MVLDPATKHTLHPAPGASRLDTELCSCACSFLPCSFAHQPGCANPNGKKPTICKSSLRTVNTQAECGSPDDFYYWTPWRAPGSAPVIDSCAPHLRWRLRPRPAEQLVRRWFRRRSLPRNGYRRRRSAVPEYHARPDRPERQCAAASLFRQPSDLDSRICVRSGLDGTCSLNPWHELRGRAHTERKREYIRRLLSCRECCRLAKLSFCAQVSANHGGGCAQPTTLLLFSQHIQGMWLARCSPGRGSRG